LDEETIARMGRQLITLAERAGSGSFVVNLAPVECMASGMLGKLITVHKTMRAAGGRLVLCHVRPYLYDKIFEVHRLASLFAVYESEEEALKALLRSENG
jgi:anti-sigma B factor antagonist